MSLSAILLLLLLPQLIEGNKSENPSGFEDCSEIVSVPIIGIQSFAYCPADNTVWNGEEWATPTPFEVRRIEKMEKRANEESLTLKTNTL